MTAPPHDRPAWKTDRRTAAVALLAAFSMLLAVPAPAHAGIPMGTGYEHTSIPNPHDSFWLGACTDLDGDRFAAGSGRTLQIFHRDPSGNWTLEQRISGEILDGLFHSCAKGLDLEGGTLAAGTPHTDLDGDGTSDGAVQLFERTPEGWIHARTLPNPDPSAFVAFGAVVALEGDTLAVGAPGDDEIGPGTGATYIYRRSPTGTWELDVKMFAPFLEEGNRLGSSIDIDGSWMVVGAPGDSSGPETASAAVYEKTPSGAWSYSERLTDGSSSSRFGAVVAVSGSLMAVGADPINAQVSRGSIHTYHLEDGSWIHDQRIKEHPKDGEMGGVVDLDGDLLVVGDWRSDEAGEDAGAVEVYTRSERVLQGTKWRLEEELAPTSATDGFGWEVSVEGNRIAVGAPFHDTEHGSNRGAVHVFDRIPSDSDGDGIPDDGETLVCDVEDDDLASDGSCRDGVHTPPGLSDVQDDIDRVDEDGDLVPDGAEPVLCTVESDDVASDGSCTGDDHRPPTADDPARDVEALQDAVEAVLCELETPELASDGSCTGERYTPPGPGAPVRDVESIAADLDADGDRVPDASEPTLCLVQDRNIPEDGTCDADDYHPPELP